VVWGNYSNCVFLRRRKIGFLRHLWESYRNEECSQSILHRLSVGSRKGVPLLRHLHYRPCGTESCNWRNDKSSNKWRNINLRTATDYIIRRQWQRYWRSTQQDTAIHKSPYESDWLVILDRKPIFILIYDIKRKLTIHYCQWRAYRAFACDDNAERRHKQAANSLVECDSENWGDLWEIQGINDIQYIHHKYINFCLWVCRYAVWCTM
jgi:hypothetical protein